MRPRPRRRGRAAPNGRRPFAGAPQHTVACATNSQARRVSTWAAVLPRHGVSREQFQSQQQRRRTTEQQADDEAAERDDNLRDAAGLLLRLPERRRQRGLEARRSASSGLDQAAQPASSTARVGQYLQPSDGAKRSGASMTRFERRRPGRRGRSSATASRPAGRGDRTPRNAHRVEGSTHQARRRRGHVAGHVADGVGTDEHAADLPDRLQQCAAEHERTVPAHVARRPKHGERHPAHGQQQADADPGQTIRAIAGSACNNAVPAKASTAVTAPLDALNVSTRTLAPARVSVGIPSKCRSSAKSSPSVPAARASCIPDQAPGDRAELRGIDAQQHDRHRGKCDRLLEGIDKGVPYPLGE